MIIWLPHVSNNPLMDLSDNHLWRSKALKWRQNNQGMDGREMAMQSNDRQHSSEMWSKSERVIVLQSFNEGQERGVLQGHVPFTEMMWFRGLSSLLMLKQSTQEKLHLCDWCTHSPSSFHYEWIWYNTSANQGLITKPINRLDCSYHN